MLRQGPVSQTRTAERSFSEEEAFEKNFPGRVGVTWKREKTFQTKSAQADAEPEATQFRETHACLYNKATGKAHPMIQDLSLKGWGSHCRILGQ